MVTRETWATVAAARGARAVVAIVVLSPGGTARVLAVKAVAINIVVDVTL